VKLLMDFGMFDSEDIITQAGILRLAMVDWKSLPTAVTNFVVMCKTTLQQAIQLAHTLHTFGGYKPAYNYKFSQSQAVI
jgi:hypothetical protein